MNANPSPLILTIRPEGLEAACTWRYVASGSTYKHRLTLAQLHWTYSVAHKSWFNDNIRGPDDPALTVVKKLRGVKVSSGWTVNSRRADMERARAVAGD